MLTYGDASYSYSLNGSLTYKIVGTDTTWYDYDLLGNLISVTLPDDTFIEYIIDGQNRRVGKKVNDVFTKGWLYQDQLNPVIELDENGDPALGFVYGTKGHVPDFMVTADEVSYRIITDHLGSVRLVVNAGTGAVAQRLEYDEFGNVIVDTNPGFQPFGYAGGLYDVQTGLVRFGARDYDAETGRWTAKDPILLSGGINLFTYCGNNPISIIDPTGLFCIPLPSKKSDWEVDRNKMFYERSITYTPVFPQGSNTGWCIWLRTAKLDMIRTITKRELCYNICNSKIVSYIREGTPIPVRKALTRVLERQRTTATRFFSGGDVEKGDWGGCMNPWTNVMQIFAIQ